MYLECGFFVFLAYFMSFGTLLNAGVLSGFYNFHTLIILDNFTNLFAIFRIGER
jgi:hypothetical protein